MTLGDFKAFYRRYAGKLGLLVIFVILIILVLGCIFAPEIFWDKFIYRYYWGPVEVDAKESGPIIQSDGYEINQGYTLVSEITYGIVLILALYAIYWLLNRFKIQIDVRFVLSVMPYFFLGGTLRVLEDAELYKEPYVYLFISPLIYFVIAIVILVQLFSSVYIARKKEYSPKIKLIFSALIWVIFDVIYVFIYFFHEDAFNYVVHPIMPIILSVVVFSYLVLHTRRNQTFDPYLSLFLFGLFLLTFSIFLIMLWPEIDSWRLAYLQAQGRAEVTTNPFGGLLVVILSVAITFCIYIVSKLIQNKRKIIGIYTNPINLLIIFGQMFDATATFIGVDFYRYSEKHPIPDFFFQTFGTSAVFLPIKMILALMIIYVIDVSFKEELKKYPILIGLIKIIVIVLGLGPGTRDCLRLGMGV
ncbi:MAG: DUF63 family protein [Thermoplasmata archaeon]|nr:MAG: DUF63 family protein [Thermoplasmata archaeon]